MGVGIKLSPALPLTLTLPLIPRQECPKSVAERALRLPPLSSSPSGPLSSSPSGPLSSSPSGAGGYDHWAPPVVRLELAKLQSSG